jgi:GMP synthase-like glutamine amidotransferase
VGRPALIVASLGSPHDPDDEHVDEVRPWLQWHFDAFTLPPGAEQPAVSDAGVQAFAHGPHLGVQFHPESTIDIVRRWAHAHRERLRTLGIDDGEGLLERGRRRAEEARAAAFELFDAFRQRAR